MTLDDNGLIADNSTFIINDSGLVNLNLIWEDGIFPPDEMRLASNNSICIKSVLVEFSDNT